MTSSKMIKYNEALRTLSLIIGIFIANAISRDFITECKHRCEDDLWGATEEVGIHCDATCRIRHCHSGCELLRSATSQPCVNVCDMYCVDGCNIAVELYAEEIKAQGSLINLTITMLNDTSVILRRSGRRIAPELTFNLEVTNDDCESMEWKVHEDTEWVQEDLFVYNLMPYCTYRLRLAAVISARYEVFSNASVPFRTKGNGAPKDPPNIENVSPSSSAIHLKWNPPSFIYAPLIGYELAWQPVDSRRHGDGGSHSIVNHERGSTSWIISNLSPNTTYRVSINTTNVRGNGPAAFLNVTTKPPTQAEGIDPLLITAANRDILEVPVNDIISDTVLCQINATIKGVGMHYRQRTIYISDELGRVWMWQRNLSSQNPEIIYSDEIHKPRSLCVDWLFDKLYVSEDGRIQRCSLNGSSCKPVITGLDKHPDTIEVDPYNGYLFWNFFGDSGGLFRVDLADLENDQTTVSPQRIVNSSSITTFMIDPPQYRLYYPCLNGTIMSVYLHRLNERNTVRNLSHVDSDTISMTFYKSRFFWNRRGNTGFECLTVEGATHRQQKQPTLFRKFNCTGVHVWHPLTQQTPVPLTSPNNLQALMSTNSALIQWTRPELDQGRGAWQDWMYEVEVMNRETQQVQTYDDLHLTETSVSNLSLDTNYGVRVRAYSEGDAGPWSAYFYSQTLQVDGTTPRLHFASLSNGQTTIYSTDLNATRKTPFNITVAVPHSVKDFAFYGERSFWSLDNGAVYWMTSHERPARLAFVQATVLAYDWLSEYLYWSNNNMIHRASVNDPSATSEIVHQGSEVVTELALDATLGYMYWSTNYRLESARLNGLEQVTVHKDGALVGFYILGLTLDRRSGFLYYLARHQDFLYIYRAALRGYGVDEYFENAHEEIFKRKANLIPHSLQYYSNKLFWLNSNHYLSVYDIIGKSLANVSLDTDRESQVTAFAVVHPSVYGYSDGYNASVPHQVLPTPVNMSTVVIFGLWDSFELRWDAAEAAADVYYRVILKWGSNVQQEDDVQPPLRVTGIPPYTELRVHVDACSNHGCVAPAQERLIRTPMAVPDIPDHPTVFVTHRKNPWDSAVLYFEVDFRWLPPKRPNGVIRRYVVSYFNDVNGTMKEKNLSPSRSSYNVRDAEPDKPYYFKVKACNDMGCSDFTSLVTAITSEERPVPILLTTINNTIQFFYPGVKKALSWEVDVDTDSLSFLSHENTIFWIDKHNVIKGLDGSNDTGEFALVHAESGATSLSLDWVGRSLFWVGRSNISFIKRYDLSGAMRNPETVLSRNAQIMSLKLDPLLGSIYWSEVDRDGQTQLVKCFINGSDVHRVFDGRRHEHRQRRDTCRCPNLQPSSLFTLDSSQTDSTDIIIVDDMGNIWIVQLEQCECRRIVNISQQQAGNLLGLPPDDITVGKERVYWSNEEQQVMYSVDKTQAEASPTLETRDDVRNIMSYGYHMQPMPDPECMIVHEYHEEADLISRTSSSLSLRLRPWHPLSVCRNTYPTVKYTVLYQRYNASLYVPCRIDSSHCMRTDTYDHEVTITGLEPYSKYDIQVGASNYYTDRVAALQPAFGRVITKATAEGIPSAPRALLTSRHLPTKMRVSWLPPARPNGEDLVYEVVCNATNNTSTSKVFRTRYPEKLPGGQYFTFVAGDLEPSHSYAFSVRAFDKYKTDFSESGPVTNTTFPLPSRPVLDLATPTSLRLLWKSPEDDSIEVHMYEFKSREDDVWLQSFATNEKVEAGIVYNNTIAELKSNTDYYLRHNVLYASLQRLVFPNSDTIMFRTSADRPSRPNPPRASRSDDNKYTVTWSVPYDGGLPITTHKLEAYPIDKTSGSNTLEKWVVVYNGSDTSCVVEGLPHKRNYIFRVAAANEQGWSIYSLNSTSQQPVTAAPGVDTTVIALSAMGVFFLMVIVVAVIMIKKWRKDRRQQTVPTMNGTRPVLTDMELATLRELPRVQVQTSNAIYAINIIPTADDVAALPHYMRDQLKLTKFLGSGAFGEVFEGVAKNILSDSSGETRVAVKTLRKGATDQEKEEFLKEAVLMSNFKHEHILRLLGVCLDNDPQFIILELMEGGDLLSFLRQSRPTPSTPVKITIPDLISICLDVVRGCEYLEEMHFVHRDLAARNCLVSTKNPHTCVVKIGDFGLARDIYKNDYYRKEGEGLLPVRWMSPESLIDGFFTTQSDVWAFGVLMWEVMSLGQQPYPARTNLEVLQFVRSGGVLDSANCCPNELYHLMLQCWSFIPEERPSFHQLLGKLVNFKQRSQDANDEFSGKDAVGLGEFDLSSASVKKEALQASGENSANSIEPIDLQSLTVKLPSHEPQWDIPLGNQGLQEEVAEASGYLQPIPIGDEFPKYLELIDSSPALQHKQLSETLPAQHKTSVESDVQYADLNVDYGGDETDNSDVFPDSPSACQSAPSALIGDTHDANPKPKIRNGNAGKQNCTLNYIRVATSDDDADCPSNAPANPKRSHPNGNKSSLKYTPNKGSLNYAHLAGLVPTDSDADTDNEVVYGADSIGGSSASPLLSGGERFCRPVTPNGPVHNDVRNRPNKSNPSQLACNSKYYNDSFC